MDPVWPFGMQTAAESLKLIWKRILSSLPEPFRGCQLFQNLPSATLTVGYSPRELIACVSLLLALKSTMACILIPANRYILRMASPAEVHLFSQASVHLNMMPTIPIRHLKKQTKWRSNYHTHQSHGT